MTDIVIVSGIDCVAAVGVSSAERSLKHRLSVDVEVSTDTRQAGRSDSLEDAIDYADVVSLVARIAGEREYALIEALAERIAGGVLSECGGQSVRVRVRKMPPPLASRVGFVGVEIVRGPGVDA